ncbi:hypothetical protein CK203_013692 [Vitis vinifera]|uniref:Uncharacterized protein n=1 Tax=Vitis vinifera TaxID=29760 RepID=A0A438J8X1_VITVI|nr:hypothetical protein CK203_013692 [Vitis vinifera]
MWVQTLPNVVQSRILSFLALEKQRFCSRDLSRLARNVLSGDGEVEFWVKRGARNLLDQVSESSYEWISSLGLDSGGERVNEEFEAMPDWLKDAAGDSDLLLPWLPISPDELNSGTDFVCCGDDSDELVVDTGDGDERMDVVIEEIEIVQSKNAPLDAEVQNTAAGLKAQILTFESSSKTGGFAVQIHELCLQRGGDSFAILGLIEPWKADDEAASVLISHLSDGSEEELGWPSQVLCSIILPKLLVLEEPASRVLVTAIIEYCKLHQRAAVYGLLFPLLLRRGGINNPICDVVVRIIKECLHPAHVSAFFQKLLCEEEHVRSFICLPCHQYLISNELVWTESLFNLLQNILNHNVHLTQDSIDHLVYRVQELAEAFSKSLKFGNFLLCLVTKCSPFLKSYKISLTEAVEHTNTLVTKSILSKLSVL